MSDESKALLGCLGFIPLTVLAYLLNGLVLCQLWQWFVVPLFGLPTLTIAQALGLGTLISYLTKYVPIGQNNKATFVEAAVASFGWPLVVLAIGWIVQLFL